MLLQKHSRAKLIVMVMALHILSAFKTACLRMIHKPLIEWLKIKLDLDGSCSGRILVRSGGRVTRCRFLRLKTPDVPSIAYFLGQYASFNHSFDAPIDMEVLGTPTVCGFCSLIRNTICSD